MFDTLAFTWRIDNQQVCEEMVVECNLLVGDGLPNFEMHVCTCPVLPDNQKKKNNQDDSDEEDDDEPGPSFQQPAAQPQPGYVPPMTQPGMPPGTRPQGMPPAGYSGALDSWTVQTHDQI